jgi:hypothetical protein
MEKGINIFLRLDSRLHFNLFGFKVQPHPNQFYEKLALCLLKSNNFDLPLMILFCKNICVQSAIRAVHPQKGVIYQVS